MVWRFDIDTTKGDGNPDFTIPLSSPDSIDIDWGDGNTDTYTSGGDKTHTYSSGGKYTILVSGSFQDTSGSGINGFQGNSTKGKVVSTTPVSGITNINDFEYTFARNSVSEIPAHLFRNNPKASNFYRVFQSSPATTVPEGLFWELDNISDITAAFQYSSLETIPPDLLNYLDYVNKVNRLFESTQVTEVPPSLFDKNPNITDFSFAFVNIPLSNKTVPAFWFRYSNATGGGAFRDVDASNKSYIPTDWGGDGNSAPGSKPSVSRPQQQGNVITGDVTDGGGTEVNWRGVVYGSTSNPTIVASDGYKMESDSGTGTGEFDVRVPDLKDGDHYRVFAVNSNGVSYSSDYTFSGTFPPTVATPAVDRLKKQSVDGNGEIEGTSGLKLSERGFVYDTTSHSDPLNTKPSNSSYSNAIKEGEKTAAVVDEGFEDGSLSPLTTSGDKDWYVTSIFSNTGSESARAGDITHNETTTLKLTETLNSPQKIKFAYKVSSEGSYDFLRFYIDGVQQDEWSGDTGWKTAEFDVSDGSHTFEWKYEKDGSVDGNADTAWVDDIQIGEGLGFKTNKFDKTITGLSTDTTYYLRAYAENSQGYAYGDEVTFTTLPATPTIETFSIGNINNTSADAIGDVINEGIKEFDVSTITFSKSISSRDDEPQDIAWNDDGTKMYVCASKNYEVDEYDVSTPYDISAASYSQTLSLEDGAFPGGIAWNDDGSKMYLSISPQNPLSGDDEIRQYDLGTKYDVTTATFSKSFLTNDANSEAVAWNDDGTKMYDSSYSFGNINEYDVSTPYDIGTASFSQSINTQDDFTDNLAWNDDGSRLFELSQGKIYQYELTTNYDISTADYKKSYNFSDSITKFTWNDDGTKLYATDFSETSIYEYDVPTYVTERGFVYDTSPKSDPNNTSPSSSSYSSVVNETGNYDIGLFDLTISGLSSGLEYYVRAYGKNNDGYSYGKEVSFITTGDVFSREALTSLPTNSNYLSNIFSSSEKNDVNSSDNVRVSQAGIDGEYTIQQFKFAHTNSSATVNVSIETQTDHDPATNAVKLEIYNHNTGSWEQIDSNNSASTGTDFTLSGSKTGSDYYDSNNIVTCRVYQFKPS